MSIYTKTGDDGTTALFGGRRVRKHAQRIAAYGTVDELNSAIGLARAATLSPELDARLAGLQHDLFTLGADLAAPVDPAPVDPAPVDPAPAGRRHGVERIGGDAVARLERAIDGVDASLPPLRSFILPGGCEAAARLHLARTVCRRAEREVDALAAEEAVNPFDLQYLNRLSDLLFVLARRADADAGAADRPWTRTTPPNE